ncbi:MAG TPA: transketolase family protein [Syntrophothermus lipocalidus]|nr:transketolase family protein [Syntrophothermus lipocalidus]
MEKIATRDAYGQALVKLGHLHEDVVVLDADLSKSTKTSEFGTAFPERFFNMGIAEQNMMGTAAGLAAAGKVVFASSFAVFATGRAWEQVRNSIAYAGLNVKIAASHAGITVGEDGASHQSVEDIALMRAIPGMKVLVPADAVAAEKLVMAAYREPGPVYLRLGRPAVPVIYAPEQEMNIGRATEVRQGSDATIIACGVMVYHALEAAKILAGAGLEVSVVDMFTVKPLDEDMICRKARETGALVTAEEHSIIGGLGGAVCEVVSGCCPVPVVRVGIQDLFGQSGTPDELMEYYGLTGKHLVEAVEKAVRLKKKT